MKPTTSTITTYHGFKYSDDFDDSEPRVRDAELAEFLEYSRSRKIRELIQRLESEGRLGTVAHRPTVGRSARCAQPVLQEYWLTEKQAYKVIAKSETAKADACLDIIIDGFMEWKQARLLPPIFAASMCPWTQVFSANTIARLMALRGLKYEGRVHPSLAPMFVDIYRASFGEPAYAEMKRRNPYPRKGSNHHQLLQEPFRTQLQNFAMIIGGHAHTALFHPKPLPTFWQLLAQHRRTHGIQGVQEPLFLMRPAIEIEGEVA